MIENIGQIRHANAAAGQHFFEPGTMRFFASRVLPAVYDGPGGVYFVTSEKGPDGVRRFTVREFQRDTGDVRTAGEFQAFGSRAAAQKEAKRLAKVSR